MPVITTAQPAEEPITLEEAKLHLRVDHDEEDTLISSLITAAREYVEMETHRAFVSREMQLQLDEFPEGEFEIPVPPLEQVTSIKYLDAVDGTEQTLDQTKYRVDTASRPARVTPSYNEEWPDTWPENNAITIDFDAGYGAAAEVPDSIKAAIKLLLGLYYENREAAVLGVAVTELPMAVSALIAPYKVYYL